MYAAVSAMFLICLFVAIVADGFDRDNLPIEPVVPRGVVIFTYLGMWQAVELIIYLYQHLTVSVS